MHVTLAWRRSGLVSVITLLAAAHALAQFDIKTEKDPAADFAAIKTYAWLPPAPIVTNVAPDAVSNPTLSDAALAPHIVAAVDRELAARGLVRTTSDAADVHVAYFAALTVGFSQTYLGEYYGYVTGWGSPVPAALAPSTSSSVHEKGTVLVDVVHRASKRAIWRGTVVTKVHQEHTLEKRIERIDDAAARLFKKFPVKSKN
ncbi:MAG TPA: DUF4136 domain-containing protein [Vicinamibacterales bacterium]|jgi:hypothetical protein|nr:DUF4136 domain-containing protein [Vicinamibacterales bacterium]